MLAEQLNGHLRVTEEHRNQAWDEKFFKLLSESNLKILAEDPQQGPDGWPYLMTETELSNAAGAKVDSAQRIFHWLATRGIGLVVNPKRLPYPDYVLSYGMIWSFRETGYFLKYQNENRPKEFTLDPAKPVKIGPPTVEFLPNYVRKVLKDFFTDQSVFDPRVLMISADGVNYDLCFSLESLGSPPDAEHLGVLEAIAWFLPPHYSLAIVSEKGFTGFQSLLSSVTNPDATI